MCLLLTEAAHQSQVRACRLRQLSQQLAAARPQNRPSQSLASCRLRVSQRLALCRLKVSQRVSQPCADGTGRRTRLPALQQGHGHGHGSGLCVLAPNGCTAWRAARERWITCRCGDAAKDAPYDGPCAGA